MKHHQLLLLYTAPSKPHTYEYVLTIRRENYALKPTGNPKGSFEVPLQRDGAESTSPFTHGKYGRPHQSFWSPECSTTNILGDEFEK
jgi:hypothetical protein